MVKSLFGGLLSLLAVCMLPLSLDAQITITSSDLLKPVGYTFAQVQTDIGPHTVDLGTTGGPQTWDFTSYSTPFYVESEVVDRNSTPFGNEFPTANLTLQVSTPGEPGNVYQYMRVNPNLWSQLGLGVDLPESTFVVHYDPVGEIGLPIAMGNQYLFELGWADTAMGVITTLLERSRITVDAYGTMTIPMGSFEVLRMVSYDTSITTVSIPPFELSDTTTAIEYLWLGQDPVNVAAVGSMEDETNPNFTTAEYVSMAAEPSGVGDDNTDVPVPRAFHLEQNTPNPFNPRTDITFTVSEGIAGQVELAVFTVRGQQVRTLLTGPKSPGTYTVSWDGLNDRGEALPSGLYLYRLTSGGESLTRKMVLAK
jgi:hypothetical protein